MLRLLILIQPPRYVAAAEVEPWLESDLDALRRDGVHRISMLPLRTASVRSDTTWGWMIELHCHSVEAACRATGEGPGMLLLDHLRMLGMRPYVALVGDTD